jgi:hypothetical protein
VIVSERMRNTAVHSVSQAITASFGSVYISCFSARNSGNCKKNRACAALYLWGPGLVDFFLNHNSSNKLVFFSSA